MSLCDDVQVMCRNTVLTSRHLTALIGIALLSGCVSLPARPSTGLSSRVIELPAAHVQDIAQRALNDCRYRVAISSASDALIGIRTERPEQMAVFVREPVARISQAWWGLDVTLTVAFTSMSPTQTRITVGSRLMGRTTAMQPPTRRWSGPADIPLTSNGTLERQFFECLSNVLQ